MLTQVESLEFTIVLDNSIEWMSKLPHGFSSELRQHLEATPPIDPVTQVPIIDLDNYCCGAHGLSILIKTEVDGVIYQTLFDTGPDGAALARNLDSLKVDLTAVDRIVLSHWHRDHSGGILEFLQRRKDAAARSTEENATGGIIVDLHPSRPVARGIAPPPSYQKVLCRLPEDPTIEEIKARGATVELSEEGHVVQGSTVFVSGEIPRITGWEKGLLGGVRWIPRAGGEGGEWVSEPEIVDERYVAVDVAGKGLVLFSACSHAGICNVVSDAMERFHRPIYAIVGGLHLAGPELVQRIEPTVEFLKNGVKPVEPTFVLPLHCTGLAAKVALANAFGERCVAGGVGMRARIKKGSE